MRARIEYQARDLKRRLDALTARLTDEREALVETTAALASIGAALNDEAPQSPDVILIATRAAPYVPGSPAAAAARDAALKPWLERHEAVAALELKTALLAEELQRYKETGELSPTPPAVAEQLERVLVHPWTLPPSALEFPGPRLDLAPLRSPPRESFPAVARRSAPPPEASAAVRPAFEHDAGRGVPESDPVPELIVLLSSSEARGRALAADQLGSIGTAAAPALPALRRALADPDRRVRASAAQALGAFAGADPGVAADLRRALGDPDEEVRLNARTALGRAAPP